MICYFQQVNLTMEYSLQAPCQQLNMFDFIQMELKKDNILLDYSTKCRKSKAKKFNNPSLLSHFKLKCFLLIVFLVTS